MEVPREEAAEDPTYRFPSVQDEYQAGLTTTTEEEIGQLLGAELLEHRPVPAVTQVTDPRPESSISSVIKTEPGEDVKPTMRTTVLSPKETPTVAGNRGRRAHYHQSHERERPAGHLLQ